MLKLDPITCNNRQVFREQPATNIAAFNYASYGRVADTRRSRTLMSPSASAARMAVCARRSEQPARAAISCIDRLQKPLCFTSSPTTLSTASSDTVNLAARAGGNGPLAASRRRRSILACRSGDRCNRLGAGAGAVFQ